MPTTSGVSTSATGISFSGLGSGIDSQAIIQKMIQFDSLPLNVMDSQLTTLNGQQGAWTAIGTAVSTFSSAAQTLTQSATWQALTAKASDPTIVTATAAAGAVPGQYVVTGVGANPMALTEQNVSQSFTSATTALGVSGTVYLGLGGAHVTGSGSITIASTDTLQNIATKINSANLGITASVVQTSPTAYKLELAGTKTGAANRIFYDDNGTGVLKAGAGLGLVTGATNNDNVVAGGLVQQAQDAQFKINGLSFDSPSNTVTTAIPGVTLNLVNLTATNTATVTVAADTAGIQSQVQSFVTAYNSLAKTIGQYTAKGGVLEGNSSVFRIMNTLSKDMTATIAGLSSPNSLTQIGISLQKDGTLAFDTGKFQAQYSANPSAVEKVFDNAGNGFAQTVVSQLTPYTQTNGILAQINQNFSNQVTGIKQREDAFKLRLQQMQDTLLKEFTRMEQMVTSMRAQGDALAQALGGLSSSSSSSKQG